MFKGNGTAFVCDHIYYQVFKKIIKKKLFFLLEKSSVLFLFYHWNWLKHQCLNVLSIYVLCKRFEDVVKYIFKVLKDREKF